MSDLIYLVTVKLPPNPDHDPHNKVTGECPVWSNQGCTDVTGEHHTTILHDLGNLAYVKDLYKHITRIEEVYL